MSKNPTELIKDLLDSRKHHKMIIEEIEENLKALSKKHQRKIALE